MTTRCPSSRSIAIAIIITSWYPYAHSQDLASDPSGKELLVHLEVNARKGIYKSIQSLYTDEFVTNYFRDDPQELVDFSALSTWCFNQLAERRKSGTTINRNEKAEVSDKTTLLGAIALISELRKAGAMDDGRWLPEGATVVENKSRPGEPYSLKWRAIRGLDPLKMSERLSLVRIKSAPLGANASYLGPGDDEYRLIDRTATEIWLMPGEYRFKAEIEGKEASVKHAVKGHNEDIIIVVGE